MTHKITISIDAQDRAYAESIVNALVQIKNSLSDKDLLDLAKLLKEKPGIIQTAKKFLS